jgi:N-acetylglucosaminyldiphosphoundecaprenol N-acetyl-beta-D-mannosaminyltransferase
MALELNAKSEVTMNRVSAFSEERLARSPVAILGVPFDTVTTDETVALIEGMIASRQPHYLATANVDFVVQAQRDVELRRILFDAHLVLCDGTPLVWASRLLGNPLPERVAGSDLVPRLIDVAAGKGYRVFFLGATPEAARRAVEKLQVRFPTLQIAGHYSPPFQPLLEMDHDEICRRVRAAQPDLLFVSFGCPKQEKWIAMHYRALGVPVTIGVGATVDFLGGGVKRAPVWMQRSGMEWMFRLAQEPRRLFKRYAMDLGVFGSRFFCQWLRLGFGNARRSQGPNACSATLRTNGWQHLELPKNLDCNAVRNTAQLLVQIAGDHRNCLLDAGEVRFIDSAGAGMLMRLQSVLQAQCRTLILLSPNRAVLRTLRFMRVLQFFRIAGNLQSARRIKEVEAHEQAYPVSGSSPLIWQGEITVANMNEVLAATQRKLASDGATEMEVDCSRLRFIDSSGAGTMAAAQKLAGQAGRRLVFTGLTAAVRNVLRFCRLENPVLHVSRPPTPESTGRDGGGLVLSQQPQA